MGRAPNSGGPQRVSAHVVPKAKPFSEDDEKTTIEADSQWGDEPSTTVEQGEVQDKIRALGLDAPPTPHRNPQIITNVTSTNAGALDESTVDDQQNPMAPVIAPARLVITGGNDAGLETDINTGKAYTIGRGLDNDIVLTDIAVSRKHFDLRNEGGSWVIVDRGSGNGTVVNGNLEDNPFMLANGDVIEIGNTTFRFDFHTVNDVPRGKEPNAFDADDDDEMSTVAGKPLNREMLESVDVELETGSPMIAGPRTQSRPKTLPPPVPLRPRTMSQAPAYPSTQPQGTPGPLPSTTLPMPQMANRPPMAMASPHSPTLLAVDPLNLANLMPTTIPGQGVQPQMQMHGHNAMAQTMIPGAMQAMYGSGYPQATEIPPHSLQAHMLVVQGQNSRGDHSTAHVSPLSPYSGGMVAVPPARFSSVQPLSKRAKYVIVLGAVTVFATIATVAIIKSHGNGKSHVAVSKGSGLNVTSIPPTPPKPFIVTPTPPKQDPPKQDPPKVVVAPPPPPKQDPPKQDPPKQDPPKQVVVPTPPKQDPPKQVVVATPPKQDPAKQQPPKQDPPKQDPPKITHQANNNTHDTVRTPRQPPKQEPPPKPDPPKRVATADPSDRANSLYQDKKFTEAGNVYLAAAKTAEPDDAANYKTKGQKMLALAHAFNNGMAPATKATEAFDNLVQANNFDSQLGGHFEGDITDRLKVVAPKAAMSFVAAKNYDKAHTAVQRAEQLGAGGDQNVKLVKQKLESEASAIYAQAIKDFDSNPSAAKEKLRQVKSMLDSKSPTFQKATTKLLGG
jgi:pSer/pThr/pTyr-binding forkhead associated (FHA) protein